MAIRASDIDASLYRTGCNPCKLQGLWSDHYNRRMLHDRRLACIGAGNMAEAIVAGLLKGKHVFPAQLMASDIRADRRADISRKYQFATAEKNADVAAWADVILLAVEPQVLDEVLQEIAPVIGEGTLVVSVAAGYPIARLKRYLPGTKRIVRAMPNTPSTIREGVTAVAYAAGLVDDDVRTARALFEPIGRVVEVNEGALDAVTGLSGSGPAYVYVMIEALADGGVKMGLPRETAQLLAAQTVAGAARMVLESREHPGALKDRVASPGGTTIAGLHELERGCLRSTLMSAVEAATKRSSELGLVT
ncbi:MAG TPA: pyrroline-5-carboxylate reductase [Nitrospira sp.]|nr:pyrroline-5-carboxylate reductase [Nitrospira sp.]